MAHAGAARVVRIIDGMRAFVNGCAQRHVRVALYQHDPASARLLIHARFRVEMDCDVTSGAPG